SRQFVEIELYNDSEVEDIETIELELVTGSGYNALVGEQNTTTLEIVDNSPTVEFGSVSYQVSEDDGLTYVAEIIRNGDTSLDSMVSLEIAGGTANLGIDYNLLNDVYFMAGESSQFVEIDLITDSEIEGTETINLQILDGTGSNNYIVGNQDTTTLEILDSSPIVEFGSVSYQVSEEEAISIAVTLTRSGDTSFDSLVRINPVGGTATLGLDYGFNNVIHFAEGETTKSVDIFLNNDGQTEGTETIELQLVSGQDNDNYIVGTQNTTTVDILDGTVVNNDVVVAEIGQITNLNHENQTIFLDHNFNNPVIFAQPLSYNGADPSTIRITDIQNNSFSVQVQETTLRNGNSHGGTHTTESFSFLVVEQGIWELSDGSILEAGNIKTDAITTSTWENINFNHDFSDTPVVLTQVQTDNDATFVRTRQNNTTNNGFQVALEEEEAYKSSGHGSENIAWLAISPGQGNWDGNQFMAGNTGDQVTHNWHTIDFGNNFVNAPKLLGNIATFDGADPSGLRYQNLTNGNVQIMIEEDTSNDSETNHTTENINFLAIEADGNLTGSVDSLTGLVTTETGTMNADTFILGNASEALYNNYGQQDYAEISDFDISQDIIQLNGLVGDYYLGVSPFESNDQAIFLEVAGMEDELVGVVKNTTSLDINSNSFTFV
ncbi:Calx-beta domain-containing protein, partial [Crocosphaera sp.]|uniref:Calx-beta domain-containing protein n=1 Tax=Crocosphaera sp. TaxID=2729996 RepID=UPI003F1ED004